MDSADGSVTTPSCPSGKNCSCDGANADPKNYSSAYRQFLKMFAEGKASTR
jgi:glucan 1,3-beta-glucosidase